MAYKLEIIDYFSENHKDLYKSITQLLRPIRNTYPLYDKWLAYKFFPGLKDGSRKIIIAYNQSRTPMGLALLKDSKEEKKICCLFVKEDYRNLGIATKLIEKSFDVLKTDKPLLTVADKNFEGFKKLLKENGFTFSYKKKGVYKKNDTELYFNNEATEKLREEVLSPLFLHILKHGNGR